MAPHKLEDDETVEGRALVPERQSKRLKTKASVGIATPQPTEIPGNVANLSQLLARAAATDKGLTIYPPSKATEVQIHMSYTQLLEGAKENATLIQRIGGISPSSIVLLHFDTQAENIQWFWAATLAGFLPAISTPFVNDPTQRKKHLLHLQTLLNKPVILTTRQLVPEFLGIDELSIHPVQSLSLEGATITPSVPHDQKSEHDIGALMLTSGSTGNAKAVSLRHGQLLSAVHSKSQHHGTKLGDTFLNWIGLDHVANLTEIHLHAMSLCCDQVHVQATDLLQDPLNFIRLLDEHKAAYTFAPNFFLSKVRDAIVSAGPAFKADLSHLRALISGGESNVVVTCDALTQQLQRFGIPGEVIRPGFGMTETCAGSIYSRACPSYDLSSGLEFANLGTCVPGLAMRVMRAAGVLAREGEVGDLQVHGTVLFNEYFNNPSATNESFTSDGWFITGDLAYIDAAGNLNMTGRSKDTIIVNGVKWSSHEIETAVEEEAIPGVIPTFTVAFPHRSSNSPTEEICVVYRSAYATDDAQARFETATAISKTVSLITTKKPGHLIPLPQGCLEKTSLGKISRTKVRGAFEKGEYSVFEIEDTEALATYRNSKWQNAQTDTEKIVQNTLASLLDTPASDINLRASIFDLGITSFNLITLKASLEAAIDKDMDIPMSVLLTDPTVAAISSSIDTVLSQPKVYNPIVPLQPHGSKTPLFCIHPGSGDILVFIALAAHLSTRPVYAVRTRGYNAGEGFFTSIKETAETYVEHIRKTQPEGPYAIAGYSLGSTLAYEVSKVLESQGQEVKFCASIDYPPHIRHYVQTLNWIDVLLHIAFFLELIEEPEMVEITPHMHTLGREAALQHILDIGDKERMKALAIDSKKLALISDIAEAFRVCVTKYDPIGKVENLDVFVADPPTYAAKGRADWRDNKLGKWTDFSKTETMFHDCPGIHAKMLNKEHIADFAKKLKAAMKNRGV